MKNIGRNKIFSKNNKNILITNDYFKILKGELVFRNIDSSGVFSVLNFYPDSFLESVELVGISSEKYLENEIVNTDGNLLINNSNNKIYSNSIICFDKNDNKKESLRKTAEIFVFEEEEETNKFNHLHLFFYEELLIYILNIIVYFIYYRDNSNSKRLNPNDQIPDITVNQINITEIKTISNDIFSYCMIKIKISNTLKIFNSLNQKNLSMQELKNIVNNKLSDDFIDKYTQVFNKYIPVNYYVLVLARINVIKNRAYLENFKNQINALDDIPASRIQVYNLIIPYQRDYIVLSTNINLIIEDLNNDLLAHPYNPPNLAIELLCPYHHKYDYINEVQKMYYNTDFNTINDFIYNANNQNEVEKKINYFKNQYSNDIQNLKKKINNINIYKMLKAGFYNMFLKQLLNFPYVGVSLSTGEKKEYLNVNRDINTKTNLYNLANELLQYDINKT